jgi:hypothetical protein
MHKRKNIILFIIVLSAFYSLSFTLNDWLSSTMPRHQIIQVPAMIGLGIILGFNFLQLNIRETSWGIAALIFIMASIIFWMLPHSVDYARVNKLFNRIMHFNMVIVGILLVAVLRNILFEIKVLFLGMLAAMILATGFVLRSFNILLCSAFDIYQQKETGLYLIIIGFLVLVGALYVFFNGLSRSKTPGRE